MVQQCGRYVLPVISVEVVLVVVAEVGAASVVVLAVLVWVVAVVWIQVDELFSWSRGLQQFAIASRLRCFFLSA